MLTEKYYFISKLYKEIEVIEWNGKYDNNSIDNYIVRTIQQQYHQKKKNSNNDVSISDNSYNNINDEKSDSVHNNI